MGTTPKRAKRAAARGFATRTSERRARMRRRLAAAATAEEQLAAAYDWFRSAARRNGDQADRSRWMREAAAVLVRMAEQAEAGDAL